MFGDNNGICIARQFQCYRLNNYTTRLTLALVLGAYFYVVNSMKRSFRLSGNVKAVARLGQFDILVVYDFLMNSMKKRFT